MSIIMQASVEPRREDWEVAPGLSEGRTFRVEDLPPVERRRGLMPSRIPSAFWSGNSRCHRAWMQRE